MTYKDTAIAQRDTKPTSAQADADSSADNPQPASFKIGLVVAKFNEWYTKQMANYATTRLVKLGVSHESIVSVSVPGAREIPLAAQWLIQTQKLDAVIAIGVVINGETAHFEYVADAVSTGVARVSLETSTPVIFGVLTAYNLNQTVNRLIHASDYADAAIAMAQLRAWTRKRGPAQSLRS